MPIKGKIDVTKINKNHLFVGKKGKYLDFALIEKPNDFGDDGFIIQEISKEAKANGEKGPIIGNYREFKKSEPRQKPSPAPSRPPAQDDDDSGIPF